MEKTIYVESQDDPNSPKIINFYAKQGWFETANSKRISELKKDGCLVIE